MKNTVVEIHGVRFLMDLSNMSASIKDKWMKVSGAVIIKQF